MKVEIKVLGPFEVSVGGVSVVPTANKPSQILALLALSAGHVLTLDMVIEELWGDKPPRSATSTVQTYILRLRKELRAALLAAGEGSPHDVLVTRRRGYMLDVDPGDVDVVRYERLAGVGRSAVNDGDHATAAEALRAALALWRGPALVDVPTGPRLEIEAVSMEEARLSDLGLRIDADLRLGRHTQLLSELATVCGRYPMLENFCAQYMLALYRSGRIGRALEVYRGMRKNVTTELGVDPSPRLQQLHKALLVGDPIVDDVNFVSSGGGLRL